MGYQSDHLPPRTVRLPRSPWPGQRFRKPLKPVLVAGTRPNFVKIAPLAAALRRYPEEFTPVVVHTGQHYDYNMSEVFFSDLEMPRPDHCLQARTGSGASRIADIIASFDQVLQREQPDLVIVVGDVAGTLACAMTAAVSDIPLAHVEAGLRCGDRRLPEEIHRVATAAAADLHYTYSEDADANLLAENVPARCIHRVGNLMIDTLRRLQPRAAQSSILSDLGVVPGEYGVVTLHRQANVDAAAPLEGILRALVEIQRRLPLVFPVHPRTRNNLRRFGLEGLVAAAGNLRLVEPLGYLDMLHLLSSSAIALVDSGGIQEETTVLGVPCLTLRESTERPITVTQGTNRLTGIATGRIVEEAGRVLDGEAPQGSIPDLWDGRSAERLVAHLRRPLERR